MPQTTDRRCATRRCGKACQAKTDVESTLPGGPGTPGWTGPQLADRCAVNPTRTSSSPDSDAPPASPAAPVAPDPAPQVRRWLAPLARHFGLAARPLTAPDDALVATGDPGGPFIVETRSARGTLGCVVAWRRVGPWIQCMDPHSGRHWARMRAWLSDLDSPQGIRILRLSPMQDAVRRSGGPAVARVPGTAPDTTDRHPLPALPSPGAWPVRCFAASARSEGREVLRALDLRIDAGEHVAVVGADELAGRPTGPQRGGALRRRPGAGARQVTLAGI